jgi:hypothetical protein
MDLSRRGTEGDQLVTTAPSNTKVWRQHLGGTCGGNNSQAPVHWKMKETMGLGISKVLI